MILNRPSYRVSLSRFLVKLLLQVRSLCVYIRFIVHMFSNIVVLCVALYNNNK